MTEGASANQGRAIPTRYTLLEKLGAGGQGEVWRARDESGGVEVALKVLNPALAHDNAAWLALGREYSIASRLDHPAILKVYPPYREGNFLALPMELATGGDLRRLRGKSYLDVIPVLIDIAQGLEYAHENGVIHRDLKPGNVLFDARGRVRLADFGIAGAPGEVNPAVARPGLSPFTASPEHLRGDPPAIADDIYGLGALAYELLSGYPPYYPRFEVKRALDEPVPDLKPAQLMPHQLGNTIMRMLAKRAALRPRSMRDVIDEFDSALNDTLTFEFDSVDESTDGASVAMRRDAAVLAAAEAAKRTPNALTSAGSAAPEREPESASAAARRMSESAMRANSPTFASTSLSPASLSEIDTELGSSLQVTGALPKRARPAAPTSAPPAASATAADSVAAANAARAAAAYTTRGTTRATPSAAEDATAEPAPIEVKPFMGNGNGVAAEQRFENEAPAARAGEPHFESEALSARSPQRETVTTGDTLAEGEGIAAAAAAVRDAAPHLVTANAPPTYWDDVRLRVDPSPQYHRPNPPRPRRSWPWVILTALAVAAILVFVVLPKYGSIEDLTKSPVTAASPVLGSTPPTASADTKWRNGDVAVPVSSNTQSVANESGARPTLDRNGDVVAAPSDVTRSRRARSNTAPADAKAGTASLSAPIADKSAADATRVRADKSGKSSTQAPAPQASSAESVSRARAAFDQRLAALEARGAGFWGGPDFAAAKTRAAESVGANDAGSPQIAAQRLTEATRLLALVESRASQSLSTQLTAGENAVSAGQGEVAKQAFESALRIEPNNRRALDGLQRVRNLSGLLPLLADGENAEAAKDYARAVQDYSQALSLDPTNTKARAGLDRAHAAFGDDSYAKAVGAGFAALGAGRLDDARVAFEKARSIRPSGAEAATGLSRVGAALSARGFASTRQKGAGLEAEERWSDAVTEYDAALKVDPSLVFAQQGRARALARAELGDSLQALIDRPERLASPAVRSEADTLIKRAAVQDPSGPVLRSQIARLQILLPGFDVPVRLEMLSDNATQVQIQRVGTFGSFAKRQIELKPGKYTLIGTRPGFRDVRRDVTIAPGGDIQTISVSCVEPI